MMALPRVAFWVVLGAVFSLSHAACASIVALDPAATYLHVNGDLAGDATAVRLADYGISGGDLLRLQRLGDFSFTASSGEIGMGMTALFSSSSTLGPASSLNRVLGAIDAGRDVATDRTYSGSQPTDIAQDFAVTGAGMFVYVPMNALYIFFSSADSHFKDNLDADHDWAVRIEIERTRDQGGIILTPWVVSPQYNGAQLEGAVPEAASLTVWGGLAAVAGVSLIVSRRR